MSMTRPPLYVRRPFLAGLVRQLPLLAVLLVVGVGLLLVTFEHWRRGLVVIGSGARGRGGCCGCSCRSGGPGFLAVRSRPVDVVLLAGAGLALTVIALTIPSGLTRRACRGLTRPGGAAGPR